MKTRSFYLVLLQKVHTVVQKKTIHEDLIRQKCLLLKINFINFKQKLFKKVKPSFIANLNKKRYSNRGL